MHNSGETAPVRQYSDFKVQKLGGNVASIQFLRFVAASLVVFWHSIEAINLHFPGTVTKTLLQNGALGASGVHIFFVISGFIMVYTSFYMRDDQQFSPGGFLSRRFIRIYPIYFIYCGLYIAFYHSIAGASVPPVSQIIASLLLLPGYSSKIIGPGWTLAYEVYFYLCFSIAMTLGLKRGILALTGFFLISIIAHLFVDTSQQAIFVVTNSLLLEFLFGAWIGYVVVNQLNVGPTLAKMMLFVALIGFIAGLIFGFHRLPSVLTWGIPSALLIAGFVFIERSGSLPKLIKKASFLGDSSYSLYLLHVLLIDVAIVLAMRSGIWPRFEGQVGPVATILVLCLLVLYCIIISLMSYNLIEHKLIISLRGFLRRANANVVIRH